MTQFNHAYTLEFEAMTSNEEGKASGQTLREAITARLASLSDAELVEACGAPFDSFEVK